MSDQDTINNSKQEDYNNSEQDNNTNNSKQEDYNNSEQDNNNNNNSSEQDNENNNNNPEQEEKLLTRYRAAMILSAVGDAFGYKNGRWEFSSFPDIYREYKKLGGYEKITINKNDFRLSDDSIMHMATGVALCASKNEVLETNRVAEDITKSYINCMSDMLGRAPGRQTTLAISLLTNKIKPIKWNEMPFSNGGGGCGGAMRSMCIGLRYVSNDYLDNLIQVSIESGRITHNNPVGFLGALVSALFTSYAIRDIDPRQWGPMLVDQVLPKAWEYLVATSNDTNKKISDYQKGWDYFLKKWEDYLILRKIPFSKFHGEEGKEYPVFPAKYGFEERDEFYASISFSGWGGSSGHDSVIISYDALLGSIMAAKSDPNVKSWEEIINRAILHSGDNDSTGAIACCWWGAIHSFHEVPECNYKKLEYLNILNQLSSTIYKYKSI